MPISLPSGSTAALHRAALTSSAGTALRLFGHRFDGLRRIGIAFQGRQAVEVRVSGGPRCVRAPASAAVDPDGNEMAMYQDMFDKQVALSISQHADLGIGRLLKRQISGKPAPALPKSARKQG